MTEADHRLERVEDAQRWRWVLGLLWTLALFTLGHLGVLIWWASGIDARMVQVELRMESSAERSQTVDTLLGGQAEQLAVLVERIENQNRRIEETNELLREYLRRNGGGP